MLFSMRLTGLRLAVRNQAHEMLFRLRMPLLDPMKKEYLTDSILIET